MTDDSTFPPALQFKAPPRSVERLCDAAASILEDGTNPDFLHAVLCQLGLPRGRQKGQEFIRSAGNASMMIRAGSKFDGHRWQPCPLPYGTKPRLALIHLCSEAVRQKSPVIDTGDGICPFLRRMGIDVCGKNFTAFKDQMTYLAVSTMTLAGVAGGRVYQMEAAPIERFEAWYNPGTGQASFWPDHIELSPRFFETLREHAVPLDPRAVRALKNSALALDVYTWMGHRLCRVRKPEGVKLSWRNLKEQFGQEYKTSKDFKRDFKGALFKARCVYPDARIEEEIGGLRLFSSPPPIPKTQVLVSLPPDSRYSRK